MNRFVDHFVNSMVALMCVVTLGMGIVAIIMLFSFFRMFLGLVTS